MITAYLECLINLNILILFIQYLQKPQLSCFLLKFLRMLGKKKKKKKNSVVVIV